MSDRDVSNKIQNQQKKKETERALAYDKECRMNDANEYYRKHNYLMKFRDGNKNVSSSSSVDPGGGGGGAGGLDPPENHQNIGFLSNKGPNPLKNHKATKPVFNFGPLTAGQ